MPLSAPAPRKLMHTRKVTCKGYLREDDLWDIEGNIVDTKPYRFENIDRGGHIEAEEPLHGMWVRLTINDQMLIKDVEAVTDFSPYNYCHDIAPDYKKLIGLSLAVGWNKQVRTLMKGKLGCTHITELMGPMATTAFQTIFSGRNEGKKTDEKRENSLPNSSKPPLLNTCHSYAEDSPVVLRHWPNYYKKD